MIPTTSIKFFAVILVLCISLIESATASEWRYSRSGGSETWTGVCSTGRLQSPINIQTNQVFKPQTVHIGFSSLWCQPNQIFLRNTGHTVQVQFQEDGRSVNHLMLGDGFVSPYYFTQLHFHWGDSLKSHGSEHTVNQRGYNMEIHLVHLKSPQEREGFPNVNQNHAVLGIFVQAFENSPTNPFIQPIVKALSRVNKLNSSTFTPIQASINLLSLLPANKQVFRYMGSLTTPPCSESVIWTVFKQPISISMLQMEAFRSLKDPDGHSMTNNFRPVKPINNRRVYQLNITSSCGHRIYPGSSGTSSGEMRKIQIDVRTNHREADFYRRKAAAKFDVIPET